MKKWYLAYCKPKEEARARAHLAAQGVESYYPMVEIEKLRRGKRVPQREPMFPNYLFIYVDLEEVTPVTLKSTRGISRIIHFGKEWTPVSSQLIYRLMSRDDSDEARASYARGKRSSSSRAPSPGSRPSIWSPMARSGPSCWSICSIRRPAAASKISPSAVWSDGAGANRIEQPSSPAGESAPSGDLQQRRKSGLPLSGVTPPQVCPLLGPIKRGRPPGLPLALSRTLVRHSDRTG